MATLDAYTRYKQLEKHYRIKLLGNSRAEAEITSQTIRVGTQKAVQRSSDKFDERDFANLQQVIDLRRSATLYYESRGINCVGHQFWLDLLLWSQDKLTADWKIRMQSSNSSPTDIENVEEEFETLNIQQPEDIPSYQQTVEEVWLLSGLNSIQEMGEWLKELWRAANVGETDFATLGHVSNCVRDLIHREYNCQSLVQNMSEQNVLKTHPLIIKIDEAVGKHINAFGQALKAVVSQCPILQSIRDPSTPKEQRDIDTWLLSITEEQWYDFSDEEVPTLGFARKTLLVKAVRTEVQHLQADIPNRFPDPKMAQYPKRLEACILNFEADTSAPIWVLCEMAAHIAGARYHIEWICAETLGRQRMLQCLGRKTTEEEAVLEWLYARWGHQIWPSGIPKDVATAHAMVGSTSTRTAKLIARGNKHVAVTSLLTKQDTGLQEAITKLKEEDKTWWVSNTDSLSVLAKLRSEMEEENCSSFWLDGAGWNAVGASTLQNHLDWDWVPRPLGPCFIGDLEASSERQIQRKIVNRFQTDIPEGYTAFVTSGRSSYSAEELQTNSRMMGLPSSDDTALLMVAHPMSVPDNAPLHSKNAVGLTIAKTDLKQELGGKGKQGSER